MGRNSARSNDRKGCACTARPIAASSAGWPRFPFSAVVVARPGQIRQFAFPSYDDYQVPSFDPDFVEPVQFYLEWADLLVQQASEFFLSFVALNAPVGKNLGQLLQSLLLQLSNLIRMDAVYCRDLIYSSLYFDRFQGRFSFEPRVVLLQLSLHFLLPVTRGKGSDFTPGPTVQLLRYSIL